MTEFTGEFFLPGQTKKRLRDDHQGRYQFALNHIKGKRVLDMACGSGYGSFMLATGGAAWVDGVDISEEAISYARQQFQYNNLKYTVSDLLTYEPSAKYDILVSYETIEHVNDYKGVIATYYDLLAPGGKLLVSTPNRKITSPQAVNLQGAPSNIYHVREFIVSELVDELVSLGFSVGKNDIYGQRLQPFFKNRKLLKMYKKVFQPHKFSNPYPKFYHKLEPRYFIIMAVKK